MNNISYYLLGSFYFLALLNPVFKKYDYGAGFPLVILLAILLLVIAIIEFEKKRERSTFDTLFLSIFVVFVGLSFIYSTTKNVGLSEVMAFGSVSTIYFLLAHQKLSWMEKFLRAFLFFCVVSQRWPHVYIDCGADTPNNFNPFCSTCCVALIKHNRASRKASSSTMNLCVL